MLGRGACMAKSKDPDKKQKEPRSIKRLFKDGVFCDLFSRPRYALGLYRELHPDDTDVTEDDITYVTLSSVFVNVPYNDLGITVGNRIMLLVEAQSTWTPNIALRALIYYVDTLTAWIREHGVDLYHGKAVSVPRPELLVVFTGGGKVPADVVLSRDFPGLEDSVVDARVEVYRGGGEGTLSEYVEFCHVGDKCRKAYGATHKAARATVDECIRLGILKEYLTERRREVEEMLSILFDQEEVTRIHEASQAREFAEKVAETTKKGALEVAVRMIDLGGYPLEDIAYFCGLPLDEVKRLAADKDGTNEPR